MAARDEGEGLSNLNDLNDYEVSDGEPDPRGWDLFAGDGVRIGTVEDLLVDTDAMRVRALECRIDEESLHLPHGDSSLFIPIRSVTLEESSERAVVPDMRSDQVNTLRGRRDFTAFGSAIAGGAAAGAIGRERSGERGERPGLGERVRERFEGRHGREEESERTGMRAGGREGAREERGEMHIPRVEEEMQVGKREVRAGEVDVRKHVETEHVKQPVEVRREEVDIERRPVSGQRAANTEIGEREVRIPVSEEEVVVGKRPVVREEIVLRKRDLGETRTAEADLRRERVDIETKGDVRTRDESERGRRR